MSSGLEVGTLVGYIAGAGLVTLLTYILGRKQCWIGVGVFPFSYRPQLV